jgi:GNAT superfamily N-acetyltransferase
MHGPTILRRLELADMDAVARVHRVAFDDRLPWLTGLHTPEEDRWYYRERVFASCEVWGAVDDGAIAGFIAYRQDWIDQFYILPASQGRGLGSALLNVAKEASPRLQLWTFQCNLGARRFYERRGFVLAEETDGSRNDEREPDVRYVWSRAEKE